EIRQLAAGLLGRTIESGSRRGRAQALAGAPGSAKELLPAIRKAAEDDDLAVRVAALAWLAEGRYAPDAVAKLEALAQPGSPVSHTARFARARLGDRRVQSWIEQDLASRDVHERLGAAVSLAALGVGSRAAPLLADDDRAVRIRAACTILLAARVRR